MQDTVTHMVMRVLLPSRQPPKCRRPGELYKVILVTERLIIHVCGQSRRKHGAVIRIAAL